VSPAEKAAIDEIPSRTGNDCLVTLLNPPAQAGSRAGPGAAIGIPNRARGVRNGISMSASAGLLLALAILAMIGSVTWLSILNGRRLARQQAASASALDLTPTNRGRAVSNIDFMWRRSDRRRVWALLEGVCRGWETKVFLFAHDPDVFEKGSRTLVSLVAHQFMSIFRLAFHARTAQQRGVLVAVDHAGPKAKFKIRGRRLVARDKNAQQLLGARSTRLRTWAPPARINLEQGWVFLRSFYILPKWIERYVPASVEICERLERAGAMPRQADDFTAMPEDFLGRPTYRASRNAESAPDR
jgi:hypothetical protein